MKFFFITSKLNFRLSGGSVDEIDLIARTLQQLGNEVVIITAFSRNNDLSKSLPYRVVEKNIKSVRLLGIQLEVYKILKEYATEADFFCIDGHLFSYGAGWYRALGGTVPIAALFNSYLESLPENLISLFPAHPKSLFICYKKKVRWYIERYLGVPLINAIDILVFVSPTLQKVYEDFGIRKTPNTLVIGDPIDYKKIIEDNGLTPDSYSKRCKRDGKLTLFYSSRMICGKGFDLLLAGFSKVKNKELFRVILGGTGPEENLVREMVKTLVLEKYVEIPGWVTKDQLFRFYNEADIFVQVGWKPEGTSISLLYAMCFGLPSILPGGGGLEWQAGKSAIYVKNGDPEDLARQIERLGENFELRLQLSRNCYPRLTDSEMNYEKTIFKLYETMRVVKNAN